MNLDRNAQIGFKLLDQRATIDRSSSRQSGDGAMEQLQTSTDVFFLLLGAILVFAMHGGFAFLEVGTVRQRTRSTRSVRSWSISRISTLCYFFIGYWIAYGVSFMAGAETISGGIPGRGFDGQGLSLVKFFFLVTFAAAVPAIISGRNRGTGGLLAAMRRDRPDRRRLLPAVRRHRLEQEYGAAGEVLRGEARRRIQGLRRSIVVHAFGGWAALAPSTSSGPAWAAMRPAARWRRRPRRFRGWRWARGCSASAGSAST